MLKVLAAITAVIVSILFPPILVLVVPIVVLLFWSRIVGAQKRRNQAHIDFVAYQAQVAAAERLEAGKFFR